MINLNVTIRREPQVHLYDFLEFFQGFENIQVVKNIFGSKTNEILKNLKVEFFSSKRGYMGVSDDDGHIRICADYLKTASELWLYLDIIHELIHVRQFSEGKKLFDYKYEYCDRPTEIEAYSIVAKEAQRLEMTQDEIVEYLRAEWMTESEVQRLAKTIGILPST